MKRNHVPFRKLPHAGLGEKITHYGIYACKRKVIDTTLVYGFINKEHDMQPKTLSPYELTNFTGYKKDEPYHV